MDLDHGGGSSAGEMPSALPLSALGLASSAGAAASLLASAAPSSTPDNHDDHEQLMAPMIGNMSVTEYVVMVLRLLRDQPGRAGFTLSEIEIITGVVSDVLVFPDRARQTERSPNLLLTQSCAECWPVLTSAAIEWQRCAGYVASPEREGVL